MKDLVLSGVRIKRELLLLLVFVVVALLLNVFAIIRYDTSWAELVTQLHIVAALGVVLYAVVGVLRFVVAAVRRAVGSKPGKTGSA